MATYRLLTRCVIDGAIRNVGELVTMPDNWKGPTRTVSPTNRPDLADAKEENLFVKIDEPVADPAPEPKVEAGADHAAAPAAEAAQAQH